VYAFSALMLLIGRQEGHRVKTFASKLVGMAKYPVGVKSFGLSCEDAQDEDDWRLRIKAATG